MKFNPKMLKLTEEQKEKLYRQQYAEALNTALTQLQSAYIVQNGWEVHQFEMYEIPIAGDNGLQLVYVLVPDETTPKINARPGEEVSKEVAALITASISDDAMKFSEATNNAKAEDTVLLVYHTDRVAKFMYFPRQEILGDLVPDTQFMEEYREAFDAFMLDATKDLRDD